MRILRYIPLLCFVFLVAIAISLSLSSTCGAKTTPDKASLGCALNLRKDSIGCFNVSRNENLDVSLTRDGLP